MLYILLSASTFGALAIFARVAYSAGVDVMTLLFLRFGLAALVFLGLSAIRRQTLPRGRALIVVIGMGAFGYAGQSFCYFSAIRFISPGLVALLLYSYPAIVTVLATVFLRERLHAVKLVALALALGGLAITIGPLGDLNVTGIALALGAALIYSVYILVGTRVLVHVSPAQVSTIVCSAAAVVFGAFVAAKGPAWPHSPTGWLAVAAVALVSTVVPILCFFAGLARIGPVNAATLSTLEPVVTIALAWMFFGDAMTPLRLLGGVMILIAVIMLARTDDTTNSRLPANGPAT
ncbi:MAG TPA: DMT family transporter [Pararobbsia sp.]|jgi:drug/metabolite transporter (DMT)-like permease|nr:DMT family transporter [Pararobbsia sp.]